MNFSKEEIDGIWRCSAAALILGQIEFDDSNFDENSIFCLLGVNVY
jgi:hypothetical protein